MNHSELDDFIERELPLWHVPGISIAITNRNETIMARGYGLRDVERALSQTPDTVHWVASCSKAFTALMLALLVEDGLLGWDTPVRDYLPEFKLRDPCANERFAVRDLLCHRSGLPRHDKAWYKSVESSDAVISRLRHLEPNHDFRAVYQYNNHMYTAAAALAARVSGVTFESLVENRILKPLGMQSSGYDLSKARIDRIVAEPYSWNAITRELRLNPHYADGVTLIAGPGGLQSTASDMARWLRMNLGAGEFDGQRVFAENTVRELRVPRIPVVDPTSLTYSHEEFGLPSYGLGWRLNMYRGRNVVQHGGSIDGFGSNTSFMPDAGFGVVVLSNNESPNFAFTVALRACDFLLGLEPLPWSETFRATVRKQEQEAAELRANSAMERVANAPASRSLTDYCGRYEHGGYGALVVSEDSAHNALTVTFHTNTFHARHFHYDVFELAHTEMEDTWRAVFCGDAQGKICDVAIKWEPNASPVVFRRIA